MKAVYDPMGGKLAAQVPGAGPVIFVPVPEAECEVPCVPDPQHRKGLSHLIANWGHATGLATLVRGAPSIG